jgi:hypothetical protein
LQGLAKGYLENALVIFKPPLIFSSAGTDKDGKLALRIFIEPFPSSNIGRGNCDITSDGEEIRHGHLNFRAVEDDLEVPGIAGIFLKKDLSG